jgi:hypothetical protein
VKEIPLTKGHVALVSDKDYIRVARHEWCVLIAPNTCYALRKEHGRTVYMHRFILGITDPKLRVDHWDRNGLRNMRSNLRRATSSQNQGNRKLSKNNTSGFEGVSWHGASSKWQAQIHVHGKNVPLGTFTSKRKAHQVYLSAARKHFGKFKEITQ